MDGPRQEAITERFQYAVPSVQGAVQESMSKLQDRLLQQGVPAPGLEERAQRTMQGIDKRVSKRVQLCRANDQEERGAARRGDPGQCETDYGFETSDASQAGRRGSLGR